MASKLCIQLKDGSPAEWFIKFSLHVGAVRNMVVQTSDKRITWEKVYESCLREYNATHQDDCIVFESESDKTLFLLKWS